MVVFVDLEGDDEELQDIQYSHTHHALKSQHLQKLKIEGDEQSEHLHSEDGSGPTEPNAEGLGSAERWNPNINGFSAALSCYPIVKSLAHNLDLNDLHSLSRTCRQFRSNLLQYHHQLLHHSLRCINDSHAPLADILPQNDSSNNAMTAADVTAVLEVLGYGFEFETMNANRKVLTGKIGKCARDLVAECRRCGLVVCRNCAVKPPSNSLLRGRYRRLCARCADAPLWMHTLAVRNSLPPARTIKDNEGAASSNSSARSFHVASSASSSSSSSSSSSGSGGNWRHMLADAEPSSLSLSSSFTAPAFEHGPCTCATRGVYLCQACGQSLRGADTTYQRVWTWRSRYSTRIGGLGTGMGEGDQGQKCGRGEECLDAVESEVEIDCPERTASSCSPGLQATDADGAPKSAADLSAGYLTQEVEGIGGVVRKKVKKRVRVGATVSEYDDERATGKYLDREASGRQRSWCGWCGRVVKGQQDRVLHGDDCFMI